MTATAAAPKGAPGTKPGLFKLPSALSRMKALVSASKTDGLTKDARSVLLHIGVYVDTDGIAYPSPSLLADDTGYSERAVRTALRTLHDRGILLSLPPAASRFAFPERGARAPKHLPLMLLWPIAPRDARMKALAALCDPPVTPQLTPLTLPPCFVRQAYEGTEQGPYTVADLERFMRTVSQAERWWVRLEGTEKSERITHWFALAAALPRVPEVKR